MPQLRLVAELKGHEDRVWQVSWDPSGTRLASCSGDKSARVWTAMAGASFFRSSQQASAMDIDASEGSSVAAWQCVDVIDNAHKRTVRSVAFEPTQGRTLATASFDGTTAIWEKSDETYECVATLEGHDNEAKCVAWAASGQLLATCGRDKSVWIWESNGEGDFDCVSVLMEHTQDVKMVLWHPKQELLVSFSYDDTIRVWREDDDDWVSAATITGHKSTVWGGAFSPQGDYLASVSDDRTVRVWTQHTAGNAAAAGSDDGFYYRPDTTYKCVAVVPDSVHTRAIYSVSWASSPPTSGDAGGSSTALADLGYLATGCGDNSLRVFGVARQAEESTSGDLDVVLVCTQENAHGLSDINCVQWNPVYPGWLATSGDDGIIRIWHLDAMT